MYPTTNDDDHANQVEGNMKRRNSISVERATKILRRGDDEDHVMIVEQPVNKASEIDDNRGALQFNEDFIEEQNATTIHSVDTSIEPFLDMSIEECSKSSGINVVDNTKLLNWYVGDGGSKGVLDEPLTNNIGDDTEILDHDPMDLLELGHGSENYIDERDAEEEHDDETDSEPSTTSTLRNINEWMEKYLWLLYEETDEYYGYCLYCDIKLNVRSYSSVKQHALSLYHKERTENYLAFREEEEKSGLSTPLIEIKQEFGTDSRTRALKLKRKTQVEALNNFNWRRWLNQHPWLKRNNGNDNSEGTIGSCKYCRIILNVEFLYLRERHETSTKHKDAEKVYQANNNKVAQTNEQVNDDCNNDNGDDVEGNGDGNDDNASEVSIKSHVTDMQYREILKDDPRSCRCLVCNITLYKGNFKRHATTIAHKINVQNYCKNEGQPSHSNSNCNNNNSNNRVSMELASKVKEDKHNERRSSNSSQANPNWQIYAKRHPWLTACPRDESFAFCLYCERRLQYGTSDIKRRIHENSMQHKQAQIAYKEKCAANNTSNENHTIESDKDENQTPNVNSNVKNNANDTNVDKVYDGKTAGKYKPKKIKSRSNPTTDWLSQFVWCKPYKKKPDKFYYCTYCKIAVSKKVGRSKHEKSGHHLQAEQKLLNKEINGGKEENVVCKDVKRKLLSSSSSSSYPWAVHFSNTKYTYYCKYCKMRLSTGYKKDKHQRTKNHIINEEIWKNKYAKEDDKIPTYNAKGKNDETKLPSAATSKSLSLGKEPSYENLIKLWHVKFPWLMYKRDEKRPFYAYCNFCEKSIFVRTSKNASRHQKAGSHIRHWKLKRNQTLQRQHQQQQQNEHEPVQKNDKISRALEVDDNTEQQQSHKQKCNDGHADDDNEQLETLKKRFMWIETSTVPNYVYCRHCDAHILCRYIQIKKHHYSEGHRKVNTLYSSLDGNIPKLDRHETHDEENTSVQHKKNVVDSSQYNTERCDEPINIHDVSRDDKNISQDDLSDLHDAFRRKHNYSGSKSDAGIPHESQMNQSKRFKRHQNDSEYYDGRQVMTDILNAPLTLASCLGPLIQQQIQQSTSNIAQNLNQSSSEKFTMHEAPTAEHSFDLFFRSISETMKKLPTALAAEGKVKIMQIICELELKALKTQNTQESNSRNAVNENDNINNNAQTSAIRNTNVNVNLNTANPTTVERVSISNIEDTKNECVPTELDEVEVSTAMPSSTSISTTVIPSVIGVMDKEGLHSIYVKRAIPSEQITQISRSLNENTSTSSVVPTTGIARSSTAATKIRCIPIKSLTDVNVTLHSNNNNINNNNKTNINSSSSSSSNNNYMSTRTQVTAALTGQSYSTQSNALANLNPNAVFNYRNVQISKKTAPPTQYIHQSPNYNIRPQRNISVNTINGSFISSPLLSSSLRPIMPTSIATSSPSTTSSSMQQN